MSNAVEARVPVGIDPARMYELMVGSPDVEVIGVDDLVPGRLIVVVQFRTRWRCLRFRCGIGSWTIERPEIATAGYRLTARAGRWVCEQVGRYARSMSEVADALWCDWHTINDAVTAYSEALIDPDSDRSGVVRALSLDETLFMREGRWRTQRWSTQLVDARGGQLSMSWWALIPRSPITRPDARSVA